MGTDGLQREVVEALRRVGEEELRRQFNQAVLEESWADEMVRKLEKEIADRQKWLEKAKKKQAQASFRKIDAGEKLAYIRRAEISLIEEEEE